MSQQINLYNPIFLQQRKVLGAAAILLAWALLLCGLLALVLYGKQRTANLQARVTAASAMLAQKQERQTSTRAQFAPRQSDPNLVGELAQARAELTALQSAAAVLQRGDIGNTLGYSAYFRAFSAQAVPGLWLTGVTIAGAGSQITLQGGVLTAALLPNFISRLSREDVMQGQFFDNLQISQPTVAAASGSAATVKAAPQAAYLEFNLQSPLRAGVAPK